MTDIFEMRQDLIDEPAKRGFARFHIQEAIREANESGLTRHETMRIVLDELRHAKKA